MISSEIEKSQQTLDVDCINTDSIQIIPLEYMYEKRQTPEYKISFPEIDAFVTTVYLSIIKEDSKNKLFCNTQRFKNNLFKFKNFNHDRQSNAKRLAEILRPKSQNDEIKMFITQTLNKMTESTCETLSNNLVAKIQEYDNSDTLDILISNVLERAIFDSRYRKNYINLCVKTCILINFQGCIIAF